MDQDYDFAEEASCLNIDSIEHARRIIQLWMQDAARYCGNAEYFRKERDRIIEQYTPADSIERVVLECHL